MALKIDYVVRETTGQPGPQLHAHARDRSSPSSSSLSLVGGVAAAAARASERQPAVGRAASSSIVFMKPTPPRTRSTAVGTRPRRQPAGRESRPYLDQQAAYEEFKEIFADEPDDRRAASTPARSCRRRFRVVPVNDESVRHRADAGDQLQRQAGGARGGRRRPTHPGGAAASERLHRRHLLVSSPWSCSATAPC